ncbi:hypothetical protein NESM_000412600 [Novymonas esmeraldas]|uniref:Uncharacterized protein n=1 Tax=Novymonas esmeraldas TaxID=1808958 RepID=A0AAW0ENN3_9TRYP
MQTRTRSSGGSRSLPSTESTSQASSLRTGSASTSTTPSNGRRRSNLPAPLVPDVLAGPVPAPPRLDGASSCPVNRTAGTASNTPHMPALSPTTASPASQGGRTPPPHHRRGHAVSGSAGPIPLPMPSSPPQGLRQRGDRPASTASVEESGSGSATALSNRLPTMMQPHKLSASATATTARPARQPSSAHTHAPSAPVATMPPVPTSPARMVSQPDVTLLAVSSPARRGYLVADGNGREAERTSGSMQSQMPIPLPPPPPLPSAPAPAQPRPSSTSSAPSSTSHTGSGGRGSAHPRDGAARNTTAGGGGAVSDTYLRENPRVRALVNNLYQQVLTTQPEEPLQYLAQLRIGTATQPPGQTAPQHGRAPPQSRQLSSSSGYGHTYPPTRHAAAEGGGDDGQTRAHPSPAPAVQQVPSAPSAHAAVVEDAALAGSLNSGVVGGECRRHSSLDSGVVVASAGGGDRHPDSAVPPSDPTTAAVVRLLRTPPSAPTAPLSVRIGSSASIGGGAFVVPPSIAGAAMQPTAGNSAGVGSSASSKHGSAQRGGAHVTNSLTSSGFLSGVVGVGAGHQPGTNVALTLHSSSGGGGVFRCSSGAAPHSAASFAGSISGVERGEMTPSDLSSLLSTNSVDLHEFIADFRLAKEERCGSGVDKPNITLDELAGIIEASSFPVPDVEVLLDLFDELQPCTRYLASAHSPMRSPPAPAAIALRRKSSPPLPPPRHSVGIASGSAGHNPRQRDAVVPAPTGGGSQPPRGGLSADSISSVASSATGAPSAAWDATGSGKLRGFAGSGYSAGTQALYGNSHQVNGLAWPGGRVHGAESCVTAAYPPTSVAAQDATTRHGRADAKAGHLAALDTRPADAAPCKLVEDGGAPRMSGRCASDVFASASPSQPPHLDVVSRHCGAEAEAEAATVPFDTLLARMAFKIQGRYPSEAIRIAFYGMVVDEEAPAAALEGTWRSGGFSDDVRRVSPFGRGMRGVVSTDSLTPSEPPGATGSGSAVVATMTTTTTTTITTTAGHGALAGCTVPLSRCIAEGLYARLGMVDVTVGEVQRSVRSAGMPTSPEEQRGWECHLEDFARLVRAVTAVSERGCSVSPANLFLTSLRDGHLQRSTSGTAAAVGSGAVSTTNSINAASGLIAPTASASWKEETPTTTTTSQSAATAFTTHR